MSYTLPSKDSWLDLYRKALHPLLLTPLPDYAPTRHRTEHVAALVVRVARPIPVIKRRGNTYYLDIEARDMQGGDMFTVTLGD